MTIQKFILPSVLSAILCAAMPAEAQQQQPYVGMHHLKANPTPAPAAPAVNENAAAPIPEDTPPAAPVYKALLPKEALVRPDDLEKWNHLDEAALATSDMDVQRLIHVIESDRGAVPPQGLFLAAKSLADRGLMEQAAIYLFVGQLRLEFDMARWPPTPNKEDIKAQEQDQKKTQDQASPSKSKVPRMDNPHTGIKYLGDQIGAPIISWVLKSPQRMDKVIKMTRAWEMSSPYGYLPAYDLTDSVPFDKWEKLLSKTREDYFTRLSNWAKIMAKARG